MLCEYDTSDIYAQYFSFCNSEEMREALEVYFLYFMFCFLSNSNKDTWWTFILHQFWDDDILGNLFEGSVIAKCFFNDHKATFIHLFNCMLNVLMKFLIIRQKDGRLEWLNNSITWSAETKCNIIVSKYSVHRVIQEFLFVFQNDLPDPCATGADSNFGLPCVQIIKANGESACSKQI